VQAVDALLQDYLQIEVCLRCSALRLLAVRDVFSFAIKMVVYPMAPLFDKLEQSLRPLCIKALLRIFNMCDADQVGRLPSWPGLAWPGLAVSFPSVKKIKLRPDFDEPAPLAALPRCRMARCATRSSTRSRCCASTSRCSRRSSRC
jgi:hypothetical protein